MLAPLLTPSLLTTSEARASAAVSAAPSVLPPTAPAGAAASTLPVVVVLNSADASVSLVDQTTRTEIARFTVGKEPHHLYPTPDGKRLIVANAMSNDLHFLDPRTGQVLDRLRNIEDPYQIGFSPDNRWFAATALRLNRLDLYQWEDAGPRVVRRIPLGRAPSHLWFSADGRTLFVTLQDSDDIAAIDVPTQQVTWRMPVGKQPAGIIVTPDDRHLMVGIMGEDHVHVIDWRARQTVARIRTGRGAHNFRGMGDQRHVFVSNRVDNTVSILDMRELRLLESFAVPGGPDCMELTADGRFLWVTSRFARQVSVVDLATRSVVSRIPVGRSPHGIFFTNRAPLL